MKKNNQINDFALDGSGMITTILNMKIYLSNLEPSDIPNILRISAHISTYMNIRNKKGKKLMLIDFERMKRIECDAGLSGRVKKAMPNLKRIKITNFPPISANSANPMEIVYMLSIP